MYALFSFWSLFVVFHICSLSGLSYTVSYSKDTVAFIRFHIDTYKHRQPATQTDTGKHTQKRTYTSKQANEMVNRKTNVYAPIHMGFEMKRAMNTHTHPHARMWLQTWKNNKQEQNGNWNQIENEISKRIINTELINAR